MAESTLVENKIAEAIELVKGLDKAGLNPTLAVWFYYDDANKWKLLLAGPAFDKLMPKQEPVAYQTAFEVLAQQKPASLGISDLKIVATKDPLPKTLGRVIGTGAQGVTRAHFVDTTVNGIFIKEMIVIRSA